MMCSSLFLGKNILQVAIRNPISWFILYLIYSCGSKLTIYIAIIKVEVRLRLNNQIYIFIHKIKGKIDYDSISGKNWEVLQRIISKISSILGSSLC